MRIRISLRLKIISLFLISCFLLTGVSLYLSVRQNATMEEERNVAVRKADRMAMDGTIERLQPRLEKAAINLLNTDELLTFLADKNDESAKMVLEGMYLSFQEEGLARFILYSAKGTVLIEQSNERSPRQVQLPSILKTIYDEAAKDYNFHYYYRGNEGETQPFPVEYCLVTAVTDDDDNVIGFVELALDAERWLTGIAALTGCSATIRDAGTGSFTITTNTDLAQALAEKDITENGSKSFALLKNKEKWVLTDILPIEGPGGKVLSHLLLSQDATAAVTKARKNLIFILLVSGGIILFTLFITSFILCKGVLNPINQVTAFAGQMASGNFVGSLDIKTRDEVADMGDALNLMAKKIRQRAREAEAISTGDLTARIEVESPDDVLGASLKKIVVNLGDIIKSVRDDAALLLGGSDQVTDYSEQIKQSSMTIEDRTQSLSGASGAIAEDIEKIASATEELSASVREISENTERSKQVSSQVQELSSRAGETIANLDNSTQKIETASSAISDFADQTNLLALNATIEAARAGEAGKGFAVVAMEVKELANQSISTTKSITQDVDEIQRHTALVVEHTGEVTRSVAELDEFTIVVSTALSEQSVVANELASTISGAHGQVKTFADNITDISDSITLNNEVINALDKSSHEMTDLANRLNQAVDRFSLS